MNISWNRLTRFQVFAGLAVLLTLLVFLNYARVMLWPSDPGANKLSFTQVERGPILDREGRLLAVATKAETVTYWNPKPPAERNPLPLAQLIGPVLGEDPEALAQRLATGPSFQYIKRRLTAKEAAGIRDLSVQETRRVTEARKNGEKNPVHAFEGVKLVPEAGRSYPEGDLAGSLIGYVGQDAIGLSGIEYTFNDVLAPALVGDTNQTTGASVWLTIDSVLQHAVQSIADRALRVNQAARVNILVAEAQTGELSAWVSSPGFDPNRFASYPDDVRNAAIQTRAYEPGSVFKIFSLSTLLDAGVLKASDTFEANGFYEHTVASTGEVIRIRDLASYGRLNVAGILEHSSNAGTGYASDRMEAAPFEEGLRRYGFGKPTGISLNGETAGLLRPSTTWSARSKPTIAMGQEVGVSALQIVQAATVLANGGVMLKPLVVRKVVSAEGEVLVQNGRTEVRQVIQKKTALQVLDMLKGTVEEGTGKRAKVAGYDIAGKTGTAQVRDPKTGRYSDRDYIASVLLYLPAEEPRYIIYLTIEDPTGASYLGGQIAAPVGKEVAEKIIQLQGLPQTGEAVVRHPGSATLSAPAPLQVGGQVPDLRGLSKRSLLPLLSQTGLQVDIRGSGWVVRQSPAPGTPLTEGLTVTVDLE